MGRKSGTVVELLERLIARRKAKESLGQTLDDRKDLYDLKSVLLAALVHNTEKENKALTQSQLKIVYVLIAEIEGKTDEETAKIWKEFK